MVESYFAAFLLALGVSEVSTGMGIVIPQFIGVTFQLLSIRSFFTKYSIRRRLIIFLSCQAMAIIPLIFAGVFHLKTFWILIPFLGLYYAALHSLNPPWNRLIGGTVPASFRMKFFSIRNQFGQFSIVVGLVIMGLILHSKDKKDVLPLFVGIFCLGLVLKALSIYEISKNHNDYVPKEGLEKRIRFRDFVKRIKNTDQGKLIVFLFFFYFCVHFASPYFGPYMLKHLKFSYLQYMLITASSYTGRVLMLRTLQMKARRSHVDKILLISTFGIALSPFCWTFTQNYLWIMFIEFISGCAWAGFELSLILLYYQKIDDHERTSVLAYIALINTTGMLIGSSLGAVFMKNLPSSWNVYPSLFIVATCLRLTLVMFSSQLSLKKQIPLKNVFGFYKSKKDQKKNIDIA